MANKTEFDVILWGGSSFVGKLVAEYMFANYGVDGELRWAIGGRNEKKLEATRDLLGAGAEKLSLLVGDARDRPFLDSMVRDTKVVLSTVGPYALYGKELIEACAASGTDYCDLSGEITFISEMMDKYSEQARASGARILTCCGVDSLPSDLGVYILNAAARKRLGAGVSHVTNEVKSFKGGFSGGTILSLGLMRNQAAAAEKVATILDNPYAICPLGRRSGISQPDVDVVLHSESGAWLGPFFMAIVNTRVVHATNAHLDYPYGSNFTYVEGFAVSSRFVANLISAVSRLFYWAYRIRPLRAILNATMLPKTGEGPSKKTREQGHFKFHFIARTRSDDRLQLIISGDRDPGYGASSRMIGEVAVCLANDLSKDDLPGGFWTPAAAIADRIIPRLIQNAGLQFRLETETGDACSVSAVLSKDKTEKYHQRLDDTGKGESRICAQK